MIGLDRQSRWGKKVDHRTAFYQLLCDCVHPGKSDFPISRSSTAQAHWWSLRMAHTIKAWPRRTPLAAKTPGMEVW